MTLLQLSITTERECTIVLTHEIYVADALSEAARAYENHLRISLVEHSERESVILVSPLAGDGGHGSMVVHEFLNYLLDLSVRLHLAT